MKRIIQSCLLAIYRRLVRTGLLDTPWGRWLFQVSYFWYKRLIEAGDIKFLRSHVRAGEIVIDVGANVGFFTGQFAKWVSGGGFVIAVEPEESNFRDLQRNMARAGATHLVKPIRAVAAERCGTLRLAINPAHPGDHRIASEGVEVTAVTIDDLVRSEPDIKVCVIKVDVQGAEERVLLGAAETIKRDHPTIYIEMDDTALRQMGSSAERVIALLTDYGYGIRRTGGNQAQVPVAEALKMCGDSRYADLLFVRMIPSHEFDAPGGEHDHA